jgi:hypothetical protein
MPAALYNPETFFSVSGTHLCYRLSRTQGLVPPKELSKLMTFNYIIGPRNSDLPASILKRLSKSTSKQSQPVNAIPTLLKYVRFEAFTVITMKNFVFWDIKTQFVLHRRHITSPLQSPAS